MFYIFVLHGHYWEYRCTLICSTFINTHCLRTLTTRGKRKGMEAFVSQPARLYFFFKEQTEFNRITTPTNHMITLSRADATAPCV